MSVDLNTPGYWDGVYRREWEAGGIDGGPRDYGPIHEAIVQLVPPDVRVLDVACGHGLLCRKIATRVAGARVVGVDFSAYAIDRNTVRDRELAVEYVLLDVRTELPLLPAEFDVVTMCEILEHMSGPGRVVADAMSLLRDGGLFVLTCPHDDEVLDPEHLRLWGHDDVFHLLEPYAGSVTFVHFPPPYFSPWLMAYLRKGA